MSVRPLAINHVEMAFRAGERDHARAVFEVLGFTVQEYGPWLIIAVDPETSNGVDNTIYCNEVIPAQQKFEDALATALRSDPDLAGALDHYKSVRSAHPQYTFHWGVSLPSYEDWQERVERVREAGRSHPLLEGRIDVVGVFEPGHPDSVTAQSQAFVVTDVLGSGPFPLGLQVELQWTPVHDNGDIVYEAPPVDELPNLLALT